MNLKKILTAAAAAALSIGALSGCSSASLQDHFEGHSSSSTQVAQGQSGSTPKGLGMDPEKRGGNYYEDMGKASFTGGCENQKAGTYNYGGVKANGQVAPACGSITTGEGGQEPSEDSAGFENNSKAHIDSVNGNKGYNGYFYNRSHLIGRALGGQGTKENLITGTRMQNVGERNLGGMRYGEKILETYVKSGKAKTCPVNYEVTPHYANATDKLPTWVEQDFRNCDGTLNKKVATFNDAAGYSIDYATGVWTEK